MNTRQMTSFKVPIKTQMELDELRRDYQYRLTGDAIQFSAVDYEGTRVPLVSAIIPEKWKGSDREFHEMVDDLLDICDRGTCVLQIVSLLPADKIMSRWQQRARISVPPRGSLRTSIVVFDQSREML